MIKKVHILNFQSHKDSTFHFDKGINVLIGRSDSGKSVVWRALYWLALNSPSGDAYRSHWGGDTLVEVWLEDNTHIQRIRTNKENKYVLNGMELTALRTEVPREIRETLKLTDSNFQGQLDASFLLMVSSGEVARVLNGYLDLQSIDKAIQEINGRARKNDLALKDLAETEKRQVEELSHPKFVQIESFEKRIKDLGQRKTKVFEQKEKLNRLTTLRDRHKEVKKALKPLNQANNLRRIAGELRTRDEEILTLAKERTTLERFLERISSLEQKEGKSQSRIKELEKRKAKLLQGTCSVCGSAL